MSEKLISVTELSQMLGMSRCVLDTHLGRFGRYMVQKNYRYMYKYNYYFLTDLREFYRDKMKKHNGRYAKNFYKVVYKLNKLIEGI